MTLSHALLMLTLSLMLAVLSSGQAPAISPSTTISPLPLKMSPPPVTMTPSPMATPPDTISPPAMSPGSMNSPPAPMAPAMEPTAPAMEPTAPTPSMTGMPPVTSTPGSGSAAFKQARSLTMLALLGAALLV